MATNTAEIEKQPHGAGVRRLTEMAALKSTWLFDEMITPIKLQAFNHFCCHL